MNKDILICGVGGQGTVLAAKGNAVTRFETGLLKEYVQLGYAACNIAVEQGGPFIIGECFQIPVADDGIADVGIQILLCEDIVRPVVVINHILFYCLFKL